MSAVSPGSLLLARRTHVLRRSLITVALLLLSLGAFAAPASAAPTSAPATLVTRRSLTSAGARAQIVREASRHVGARYRWGASGPSSFDCSGFTQYVYSKFGLSLPHQSGAQLGSVRRIPSSQKQPGDLIFFRTSSGRIDHVGIYAGGNKMYAASRGAGRVKLQTIYSGRMTVGRVG